MILSDDQFARLVAEDVKNKASRAQQDYLALPENWDRHQRALVALRQNLDRQLAELAHREESEGERLKTLGADGLALLIQLQADLEERRTKISRFQFHVDRRLDEVTRQIALGSDQVEERIQLVEFFRKAIERHHDYSEQAGYESTKIDRALWASLDGEWQFDDIDLTALD